MSFFEVIKSFYNYILEVFPSHIVYLMVNMIFFMCIELIFLKLYDIVWDKKLNNIETDLADAMLFKKHAKDICYKKAESQYFNKNNNFIIELIYFLLTTMLVFIGLVQKSKILISIFFIIKTTRNILITTKVNLEGLNILEVNNFDEKDIYFSICSSNDIEISKIFEAKEPSSAEEFSVLELKFNELIRYKCINKDILLNLINTKEVTSSTINMINMEYSKMTQVK